MIDDHPLRVIGPNRERSHSPIDYRAHSVESEDREVV